MDDNYLIVVGQLGNGGLEKQLYYILTELKEKQLKVQVVVWNGAKSDYYYDLYLSLLGKNLIVLKSGLSSLNKFIELRRIVILNKFDIVISFSAFTNLVTYFSTTFTKSRVFGSLRTSFDFYYSEQRFKALLNVLFPNRLLVNSMAAINEINNRPLLSLLVKGYYLQNVIDLNRINLKSEQGLSSLESYTTVSIGNIRKAKRLDRMVNLFSYIKSIRPDLNIKHIHIGGGEIEDLQKSIMSANLNEMVKLLGPKDNVFPYLRHSKLLLHFSEVEGASNVVMEAMALGKPIVSTNCGDTCHYIMNGINGFIVNHFSVEEFSSCIFKLLEDNKLFVNIAQNNVNAMKKYDISQSLNFLKTAIEGQ